MSTPLPIVKTQSKLCILDSDHFNLDMKAHYSCLSEYDMTVITKQTAKLLFLPPVFRVLPPLLRGTCVRQLPKINK